MIPKLESQIFGKRRHWISFRGIVDLFMHTLPKSKVNDFQGNQRRRNSTVPTPQTMRNNLLEVGVNVDQMDSSEVETEWSQRAVFNIGHISRNKKRKTCGESYSSFVEKQALCNSSTGTKIVKSVKKNM